MDSIPNHCRCNQVRLDKSENFCHILTEGLWKPPGTFNTEQSELERTVCDIYLIEWNDKGFATYGVAWIETFEWLWVAPIFCARACDQGNFKNFFNHIPRVRSFPNLVLEWILPCKRELICSNDKWIDGNVRGFDTCSEFKNPWINHAIINIKNISWKIAMRGQGPFKCYS